MVSMYIRRRQNTVVKGVTMRPILDLCQWTGDTIGGERQWQIWWDQVFPPEREDNERRAGRRELWGKSSEDTIVESHKGDRWV